MRCIFVLFLSLLLLIPCAAKSQITDVVYVIGRDDTILKLEYGYWEPIVIGPDLFCGSLFDIWGSSSDDIYITGCDPGSVLHYDGIQWELLHIPDATPPIGDALMAVAGTGPDNIYVGGYEYIGPDCIGVVHHYDGTGWTYIGGGSTCIDKLWADPGGGLYGIGSYYDYFDRQYYSKVISYESGTWSTEPVPVGETQNDEHYGIDGAGPDRPFVTGQWCVPFAGWGGSIFKKQNSTWSVIHTDFPCDIYSICPIWPINWHGVWCESESDVWFAGENGRVMHWTPDGYIEYDTGVTQTLRSIWGRSNSDVFAVGDYGRIVHFNGINWTYMPTPTTEDLRDIWGLFELPVATLLQSFSTEADASRVTIRWSLSQIDQGATLRVSRMTDVSAVYVIDENADIDRDGLSFTYADEDVEPGREYSYLVEYSSGEGWLTLIETGRIGIPFAPLALMPNYPNPFNPSTRITYSVPETGHVSLVVYDVSGRLVRTLVSEMQGPGTYVEHWDGMNDEGRPVASGSYFCRLVTAKRAETRKMLLTR